ncbi:MAG: hypothetical protein J6M60_05705 [Clostridia bacterium]|nr:hypothetical protein [Clostridia bacterium]
MNNEEYAELLEAAAKKIRCLKTPISKKTENDIKKVSKSIIKEGKKIENMSLAERASLPRDKNLARRLEAKRILEGKSIVETMINSKRFYDIEK